MSLMTHESKWRLLVGAAPLIGVAFIVWAAAQGLGDVARSPTAGVILAVVAALGAAVAWWTARQLRATAAVPVSRAGELAQSGELPGTVALHGRAHALPDAEPLVSPDGELCLWFRGGHHAPHPDSVRPFLLVDDSGECIVLTAGADVTSHGPLPTSRVRRRPPDAGGGAHAPDQPARLLRNGDRVHVTGRFVAASPESLALQAQAAALVARAEAQAPLRGGDLPSSRDPRSAARAGAAPVGASPPRLPVIASPESGEPLRIRIGSDDGEGGIYGVLAVADCLVLLVSSSLAAWGMLTPA